MKRFSRGSCLGLLLFVILAGVVILSAVAILFQQSQAVSSNTSATVTARVLPTRRVSPSTVLPFASSVPNDDVMIQIDTPTAAPQPAQIVATPGISTTASAIALPSALPDVQITASALLRYLGTSSYPLTVTAEVMLAQTHVASYQSGVAATRTAIAAESIAIYASLTASAPTNAPGAP